MQFGTRMDEEGFDHMLQGARCIQRVYRKLSQPFIKSGRRVQIAFLPKNFRLRSSKESIYESMRGKIVTRNHD